MDFLSDLEDAGACDLDEIELEFTPDETAFGPSDVSLMRYRIDSLRLTRIPSVNSMPAAPAPVDTAPGTGMVPAGTLEPLEEEQDKEEKEEEKEEEEEEGEDTSCLNVNASAADSAENNENSQTGAEAVASTPSMRAIALSNSSLSNLSGVNTSTNMSGITPSKIPRPSPGSRTKTKPEHLQFPTRIPAPKARNPAMSSDEIFRQKLEEMLEAEADDVFAPSSSVV